MRVYVAGSLADVAAVREVQAAVESAGHRVTHDWTRGLDVVLEGYAADPGAAGRVARTDLVGVLDADALVVVAGGHPGRGMFVELGAALALVELGRSMQVVVVGSDTTDTTDSVFYFHPAVRRHSTVARWLASLDS